MAMCATQSYPEQVKKCPAASDRNILDPAVSPKHVGQAYTELQFYPPGWVPWPTWQVAVGASSCNPTQWCAALNIDSLALNPVTGKTLNPTCLAKVGEEYVNFAFVTKNGKAQAPANPVDSTVKTFTPSSRDLYMNSGDRIQATMTDTRNGLKAILRDLTTGATGSMTASAANGFAQVKYAPDGQVVHGSPVQLPPAVQHLVDQDPGHLGGAARTTSRSTPRSATSSSARGPVKIPATPFGLRQRQPDDVPQRGHRGPRGQCPDTRRRRPVLLPGSEALLYKVNGCAYTNTGFDGASYQTLWPDGNPRTTRRRSSSPARPPGRVTRSNISRPRWKPTCRPSRATCNPTTGAGCTLIPQTDQKQPAAFYPFYSITNTRHGCVWQFGNDIPGQITDFGRNAGYGSLLALSYTQKGGSSANLYQDFRNIFATNPCPAR